jgi:hypothetical protein
LRFRINEKPLPDPEPEPEPELFSFAVIELSRYIMNFNLAGEKRGRKHELQNRVPDLRF